MPHHNSPYSTNHKPPHTLPLEPPLLPSGCNQLKSFKYRQLVPHYTCLIISSPLVQSSFSKCRAIYNHYYIATCSKLHLNNVAPRFPWALGNVRFRGYFFSNRNLIQKPFPENPVTPSQHINLYSSIH